MNPARDYDQRMVFPARYESLEPIRVATDQAATACGLNEMDSYETQLAVDEACTNIIEHAYGREWMGEIECRWRCHPDGLQVTLLDDGRPFDPHNIPPPDLNAGLDERTPGGLGLVFIRRLMDQVEYQPLLPDDPTGKRNCLTLFKRRN
jgi:serine/threonine-protein kinase RsbW